MPMHYHILSSRWEDYFMNSDLFSILNRASMCVCVYGRGGPTLKQASSGLGMVFSPQLGNPSHARLRDMHSFPLVCWNFSSVGHSYSAPSTAGGLRIYNSLASRLTSTGLSCSQELVAREYQVDLGLQVPVGHLHLRYKECKSNKKNVLCCLHFF